MNTDLISRSALLKVGSARKIIEAVGNWNELPRNAKSACTRLGCAHRKMILEAPAVDAVVLPIGRPGGYLEWDDGVGHRQIYRIHSIMICEDCMRYELSDFSPVVSHKGIVRILSPEDVETLVKERGKAWKYVWCEDNNKAERGTEG